jgi:hypothetical protein
MLWEDHRNDLFINSFGESPRLCRSGLYIDALVLRPPHVSWRQQTGLVYAFTFESSRLVTRVI